MHNKSLTADAQARVIGGRNVVEEYFGARSGVLKVDLDALLVGPVVENVANDFDRYSASQSSYPVDRIVAEFEPAELSHTLASIQDTVDNPEAECYPDAIRDSTLIAALFDGDPGLNWSQVQMVTDDPAKGLGKIEGEGLLLTNSIPFWRNRRAAWCWSLHDFFATNPSWRWISRHRRKSHCLK